MKIEKDAVWYEGGRLLPFLPSNGTSNSVRRGVSLEEDFRETVDSVFEALNTLQVRLEETEEALEGELEDEEE